ESPIHSWNRILPSVVSASKSGAVSLIDKPIFVLLPCTRPCRFYWIMLAFASAIALAGRTFGAIATDRRLGVCSASASTRPTRRWPSRRGGGRGDLRL